MQLSRSHPSACNRSTQACHPEVTKAYTSSIEWLMAHDEFLALDGGATPPAERAAGNALLDAVATGLSRLSVVVALGLELVDRAWSGERVGRLPDALLRALDDGHRAVRGG